MTDEKLRLKEAVVVEGRYDRIRLSALIATPVLETGGFRVFKDKERQQLLRRIAEERGILVMTDVDSAGFVIRGFLRGIIPEMNIKHAYIPSVLGKESRKPAPSKEGLLGVEGLSTEALQEAIERSGATILGRENNSYPEISKSDFYSWGLSGTASSKVRRTQLLSLLALPPYLSTNAMIAAVNCIYSRTEFVRLLEETGFLDV